MGARTNPAKQKFFLLGNPRDLSATSQRRIFTKFGRETYVGVPSMNPERHFRKSVKQAPHSDQATSHGMHCLPLVAAQGLGSFQSLVNFSVRRTVAELRGVKIAQFSDFGLFFPYKTPKT